MEDKFAFLKSVRFWNLVVVVSIYVLQKHGILIDQGILDSILEIIQMVLLGSTAIRTVDRFAEKAGAVDTGAVIAPPTPGSVDVPKDQTGTK